jgi:hypothetical protein
MTALYARGGLGRNAAFRVRESPARAEERVLEAVTIREIERIFEVTDRLGIHRESLVIPLRPLPGGRLRRLAGGKLEIVVDAQADFAAWLVELESGLRKLSS